MQAVNMMRKALRALLLAILAGLLSGGSSCDDNLGDTSPGAVSFRVSIAENTTPANDASWWPATSADGRYVAFASRATNLVLSKPGFKEIFVRDRQTDRVENVSRLAQLADPSELADCDQPSISADGRYVVFVSKSDLEGQVSPPTPGPEAVTNVFRVDRLDPDPYTRMVAVYDGSTWPNDDLTNPTISEDGNRVAFQTAATNVGGFTTNGLQQVIVRDLSAGFTLISHINGNPTTGPTYGCDKPMISADGLRVVFQSQATDLTPVVTPNRRKIFLSASDGSSTDIVSLDNSAALLDNHCGSPSVSRDGRFVAFDYQGGTFAPANPSDAMYPVLRRDTTAGVTDLAASDMFLFGIFSPVFNGDRTSISDDGRMISYVAVNADVTDLEVKVRDMQGGLITASRGIVNPGAFLVEFPLPSVSGDGRWLFWGSEYTGQVIGDTNSVFDVFGYGPLQ